MKKIPPKKILLIFSIITLIIIGPAILFIGYDTALLSGLKLSYFFLIFTLFIAATPYGKIRLAASDQEKPVYSVTQWLTQIITWQLALLLILFGVIYTASQYIPLAQPTAHFTLANEFLLKTCGLFPWTLYATLAVIIGYFYYCKRIPPVLSSMIPSLKNPFWEFFFKRALNMFISAATNFALSLSISFGGLQLALGLAHLFGIVPSYSLNVGTIALCLIIFSLLMTKHTDPVIKYLCRLRVPVGIFLLILMLLLGVILAGANLVIAALGTITLPVNKALFHSPSHTTRLLFYWSWCVASAPLASSYIVKVSQGRSLRSIIFSILFLPAVVTAALIWSHGNLFTGLAALNLPLWLNDLTALIGPILIICLLLKTYDSGYMVTGLLNAPGKQLFARPRHTIKFIKPQLQMIAVLGMTYIWFNIFPLSFLLMLLALPCAVIFAISGLVIFMKLPNH